jgi:hypothetical protein
LTAEIDRDTARRYGKLTAERKLLRLAPTTVSQYCQFQG